MKKIVSIFLLYLLLYHTVGYHLFLHFRQQKIRSELRTILLTNHQPEKDWFIVSVPITVYHQIDRDFEHTEGEFVYRGKVYEKALQRIKNDTLFLYCVNNKQQEQVKKELSDYLMKYVIDSKQETKKHAHELNKVYEKSYYLLSEITSFKHLSVMQMLDFSSFINLFVSSVEVKIPTPPPRYHSI
ncbi:hypothetical protein [Xanthocytophaga agilis]|uniref:Uncharacterized protein n=1 Tax=Xanthocytophaga agilis TaxID=3048010 RepID=A0AAE3UAT8_9BACT|nr:hypothetical protein [Xanthocytophaga agilis]MDJ1499078.1 hypothetical protein [Xanthocytophaga agilis]